MVAAPLATSPSHFYFNLLALARPGFPRALVQELQLDGTRAVRTKYEPLRSHATDMLKVWLELLPDELNRRLWLR